jgi:MFS family permease
MKALADALQSIAVTLWVGGMWAVGFIVAPLLFARLGDRALAGLMAGKLFSVIAWIGVACAIYLIVFRVARFRAGCLRQAFFWITLGMLALVLAGQFGVQPVMEALRAQALPKEVMESVLRDRFMTWHGVASVLYIIQSALGVALVVLLSRAPR